jgi:hypothetical protein
MLRRMPGESDLGFYGSESEDQQAFLDEGPYAPDEDNAMTPEEPSTSYSSPGYRDTYTSSAATSVPLSPWCIIFYIVLPCFALFCLVVMIYYWGCCPSCLGCYRDNDDNKVWRDQSQKVRGGSEKTEGTAENNNTASLKPNGVPTSIAISIPDESAQPQKQHIQRDNKPPRGAPEVPSSSWRSWLHRSKKSVTSAPPSSST